MADSFTTHYGFTKPQSGGSLNTWGVKLNGDLDSLDTVIYSNRKRPGEGALWFTTTPPDGALLCNGAAVSRTTYAALFAVIGTTWGAGDGATTFNLPDLRGYFPRGYDAGRGVDSGRVFASTQADANLAHTHSLTDPGHTHGNSDPGHTHTSSITDPGHRHIDGGFSEFGGTSIAVAGGANDGAQPSGGRWYTNTATTGISISNSVQTANITINSATTGASAASSGGAESRPKNIAINFIIFY